MTKLSRQPKRPDSYKRPEETQRLERRYGAIGISAVAAASCLRKPEDRERDQRRRVLEILARFEERT